MLSSSLRLHKPGIPGYWSGITHGEAEIKHRKSPSFVQECAVYGAPLAWQSLGVKQMRVLIVRTCVIKFSSAILHYYCGIIKKMYLNPATLPMQVCICKWPTRWLNLKIACR